MAVPLFLSSHVTRRVAAYFDALPGAVDRHTDADGRRVEIVCAKCGGHLGHVFKGERFHNPVDERHCVNSVSLKFAAGETHEGDKYRDAKAKK